MSASSSTALWWTTTCACSPSIRASAAPRRRTDGLSLLLLSATCCVRGEDPPAAKMGLEEAKREIRRLEAILAPLAPVEADRQALAQAADAWAPASMALRLRIVRKAALRRRLDALQSRLEGVLDSRGVGRRGALHALHKEL